MTRKEIDEHTGTETTGHEWDGIKELNTPLPRWWLWLFYITIIWSIGYWVVMPAWPLVSDYTRGILNHSQRRDVAEAVEALKVARADFSAKLSGATLQQIEGDPRCCNSRWRRASRRSATIARPATARAVRVAPAIPTSTTTCGCGAARSTTSAPRSRSASARRMKRRASRSCPRSARTRF